MLNGYKLTYLGIVLTMLILPIGLITYPLHSSIFIAIYILLLIVTRYPGYTMVIMALAMCIPHFVGSNDVIENFATSHSVFAIHAVYLTIFIACIKNIKYLYDSNFKGIYIISSSILFLSLFYGMDEFINWCFNCLILVLFFNLCKADKINTHGFIMCFSIMMVIHTLYILLEFFLQLSPYMYIKAFLSAQESYGFANADGIVGNSLIMCSLVSIWQVVLFYDFIVNRKFIWQLYLLSLAVLLFCGSRTGIVITIINWCVFFFYILRGSSKKIKFLFLFIFVAILSYIIGCYYFSEIIELVFGRFSESSEHRSAGYGTAYNILLHNIFGVGSSGVEKALSLYSTDGFLPWFKTFDNFYLTYIAYYGILAPIIYAFYFYYPYKFYKLSRTKREFRFLVFWFVAFAAIGFSFNLEAFMMVILSYFGGSAHIYRNINSKS